MIPRAAFSSMITVSLITRSRKCLPTIFDPYQILNLFLTFDTKIGVLQLDDQRPAVNALNEAAPELGMHRLGRLQNLLNQTMSFDAHRRITSNHRSAACGLFTPRGTDLTGSRDFKYRRCRA